MEFTGLNQIYNEIKQIAPPLLFVEERASWINLNKIPLAETGLTQVELEAVAPYLHYVDCRGLDIDESFISLCSNALHLFIKSDKIEKLEELPAGLQTLHFSGSRCKVIDCWKRTALTSITLSEVPQLQEINCSACTSLTSLSLPEIPQLAEIHCYDCTSLVSLSLASAPELRSIYCQCCTALTSISFPEVPKLQKLDCSSCPSLTSLSLPETPELQELYCYLCKALTSISLPNAPLLKSFYCYECIALTALSLPNAPLLKTIQCFDCTNLATLPLSLGQSPHLTEIISAGTRIDPAIRNAILNQCRKMRDAEAVDILPPRLEKWKTFAKINDVFDISALSVMQKMTLNEWLLRLERTKDFAHSQTQLATTVCNIVSDLHKKKEFQELFFPQAEANNACCEDRAAMSLNEIYTSWKIICAPENLKVLAGVAKTLRLRKELQKLINKNESESVEIFLYYESTLRERLKLVTAIQNMTYRRIGKRDWIDEDRLVHDVEAHYFEELIELPAFEKMIVFDDAEFSTQLEQLGECPKGAPNDASVLNYQHRQGEIMQERKRKKIQLAKRIYHD